MHNYKVVRSAKCDTCQEYDFFHEKCKDKSCSQENSRVRECACARKHRKHLIKTIRSKK